MHFQYAVVGGGVVGLSVALGLCQRGYKVGVFDEGDVAFRASRGNFGLVWVQGKGVNQPAYAKWSQNSAALWPEFSELLEEETGAELHLQQQGGFTFHLQEDSLAQQIERYTALANKLDNYPFDVLGHNALRKEEPNIGPRVVGAVLHHQDGHVNSLQLLKALARLTRLRGVEVQTSCTVTKVEPLASGFRLCFTSQAEIHAEKVVICAGLGAKKIAPQLGFLAPVRAQRGQVLITEKLPPLMRRPSGVTRQVDEGGVQIGASEEEVGENDSETLDVTATLAKQAITLYPALARANVLRSWSALRIMSPDGLPIYQQSAQCPGAYFITCHSGITLAAAHALLLPKWIADDSDAPDLSMFSEARFHV